MQILSETHWGTDGKVSSWKVLSEEVATHFGISGEHLGELISRISISGLLGNSDEIDLSALAILKVANRNDFVQGRKTLQFYLGQIAQLNSLERFPENVILARMRGVIQKASNSALTPDWLISTLVSAIVAAHKLRKGISG